MQGLDRLRDLLGVYDAGTWFVCDSSAAGFRDDKTRPMVLIEQWKRGRATVRACARSASARTGYLHEAHPAGHDPHCQITKRGRIVFEYCVLSSKLICSDNYSCVEPDRDV